jgi:GDPmannose 4,6-dehydratase
MGDRKRALITGITGQDGSYLSELLLEKGYEVHGVIRRTSTFNTDRIDHIYVDPHQETARLRLHYGDLTDGGTLRRIIELSQPDEIYNLGAQSHVRVSFDAPQYTVETVAMGTLRLLEAIREYQDRTGNAVRFYQAGSSEMFGLVQEVPQRETTPFYPRSPYACAKVYAHWQTVNYREAYNLFACNGILFNHECIPLNTPLIVRINGTLNVVTPRELIPLRRKGPNVQHFDLVGVEVWDGRDWTAVVAITATKRRQDDPDHELLAIHGRGGVVTCTAHHTLIRSDETECRADSLQIGDTLLLAESMPPTPAWTAVTPEMGEFLGLMAADGYIPSGDRTVIQFTNNDPKLQQRIAELWSRLFLGNARFSTGTSEFDCHPVGQTYLSGSGQATVKWLRSQLYSDDGLKRVPPIILNANPEIQAAFLGGYYAGDGLKAGNGESIRTNSPLLAQGLYWLYAHQGRTASVYLEQRHGRSYYQLNLSTAQPLGEKGQHLRQPAAEIRKIDAAAIEDDEWVVDLATQSGRFVAGVGCVVVHNSPRRGETFVTRKITRAVARIVAGLQDKLYLGNLDAQRDWGYAKDYVRAMWLMLQHPQPDDYVVATGETHSVREFLELAFGHVGLNWQDYVEFDPRYLRPTEVDLLLGDPTKAKTLLGWQPSVTFPELVALMVQADLHAIGLSSDAPQSTSETVLDVVANRQAISKAD